MQRQIISFLFLILGIGLPGISQAPKLVVPTGHAAPITALALSPQGAYVFTGGNDGNAILWNQAGVDSNSF